MDNIPELNINKYSLKFLISKLEEDFQSNLNKLTSIQDKIGAFTVFALIILPISFLSFELYLGCKEDNVVKITISIVLITGNVLSTILEIICFLYSRLQMIKGIFFIFILFPTITEYSILYQAKTFGITISSLNMITAIIFVAIAYNKRWFICSATTTLGNIYFLVRYMLLEKSSVYQKLILIGTFLLIEMYFIFLFYLNELLLREHFFLMDLVREKKNFFKKILKQIPTSIFVYVNGKLDMINNTMKQMLGISLHEDNDLKEQDINEREKKYKKYLDKITDKDDVTLTECLTKFKRKSKNILNDESNMFYLNKNEQKYKMKLKSVDYHDSDREVKIYVLEDCELNIRITKETESKYKRMMIASFSHDIFTPINGITGIIDSIDENLFDKATQKKFTSIKNSCVKFMYYISILKNYSLIESDTLKINNTTFDVIETIKTIAELLKRDLKAKKITLTLNLKYSRIEINSDLDKFSQIIFSLFDNAVKHTYSGSINAKVLIESNKLNLCIEDTGEGINSDNIKSIFDMFVITSQTNELNPQGIGMSLYVCQRLANALGTKIEVSSIF